MSDNMELDEYNRRSRSPPRRNERRDDRRGFSSRRGGRGGPLRARIGSRFESRGRGPRESESKSNRVYENSIFVGNLPYHTTWYDLKDLFREVGEVVRADVVTSRGRSRGMGTVEFANKDLVQEAISKFDRTMYEGREIFVREDLPPPEKESTGREERRRNAPPPPTEGYEVFIGNLPFSVRWQDLKDLFKSCGPIIRADVREDHRGRSKGFGTVIFENSEDADRAIADFNGYDMEGRRIEVRLGKQFIKEPQGPTESRNSEFVAGVVGQGEPSDTIFADNLPWETSETDLFDLFGSIASVKRAELQFDDLNRPAGSAVVQFQELDGAIAAVNQLDNYEYGRRRLHVSFAKRGDTVSTEQNMDVEAESAQQPDEVSQPGPEAPAVEPTETAEPAPEQEMEEDHIEE
ncbi:hypothetical protein KL921_002666 [Ogataea angusta]|nr:hypothetical protein KL921_002666 [Ogataea angusta]KAG7823867.1 hypothetical protein KL909_002604 [Ogataea angusta]KAG7829557.1 hypothetical protein KL920_002416 [Ogataea angusta]KAG7846877.1 hypothetical protein KL941_002670 [Ogataea angusta]KAG7860721.1 hypothetical protein KL939_001288 [Ogataea angusta]